MLHKTRCSEKVLFCEKVAALKKLFFYFNIIDAALKM